MNKVIVVPVFNPRSITPAAEIGLDDARLLVREGHAKWINRCSGIRFLREGFDVRGLSCRLRPTAGLSASPEVQVAINAYRGVKLGVAHDHR